MVNDLMLEITTTVRDLLNIWYVITCFVIQYEISVSGQAAHVPSYATFGGNSLEPLYVKAYTLYISEYFKTFSTKPMMAASLYLSGSKRSNTSNVSPNKSLALFLDSPFPVM